MLHKLALIVTVGLSVLVLGCTDDEALRNALTELEERLAVHEALLEPSSIDLDLGEEVALTGLSLQVKRAWVETDRSGQYPRLVAEIELRNRHEFPQVNRFGLVALTPSGEVLKFATIEDPTMPGSPIESWELLPAESRQQGYLVATDYRAADWLDAPMSVETVLEDLLRVSELLVTIDGSSRIGRVAVTPERGQVSTPTPAELPSATRFPTFLDWTAWAGTGSGAALIDFNPANALSQIASIIAVTQTGNSSSHPQAIACMRWLLSSVGSPTDCGLVRSE